MNGKLYFKGQPTDAEVISLLRHLRTLAQGSLLTHDEIASITGVDYGTCRYRSIIVRVKKKFLSEDNLILHKVPRQGYQILTESQRLSAHQDEFDNNCNRLKKTRDKAAGMNEDAPGVTPQEKKQIEHLRLLIFKTADFVTGVRKQISLPTAEQLPRLGVVK